MDSSLGQFVLNCKAKVSRDYEQGTSDNEPMAQKLSESDHLKAFIERTRLARLSHSLHQTRICTILEIDQGTYKQYERRTPLPHRHIPKFCAATGVRFEWLLANEGQGPDLSRVPKNLLERPTRRHRAASKRHKAA